MCNRILLMSHGQIITDGSLDETLIKAKALSLETAFRKLTGGSHV